MRRLRSLGIRPMISTRTLVKRGYWQRRFGVMLEVRRLRLAQFDLKSYARRGAEVRLGELKAEMDAIYAAFPDLRRGRPSASGAAERQETPVRRRRRRMSVAARRRIAAATKARWAAAKKAGKSKL